MNEDEDEGDIYFETRENFLFFFLSGSEDECFSGTSMPAFWNVAACIFGVRNVTIIKNNMELYSISFFFSPLAPWRVGLCLIFRLRRAFVAGRGLG